MARQRLDKALLDRGLVESRSQGENWIKLGKIIVNGRTVKKSGYFIDEKAEIKVVGDELFVSRAGLKLASVSRLLKLNFKNKIILDVGSSTGGFTDFALQNGASKIIAVDVGTNQMHPSLRVNKKVELHEKTDIRTFSMDVKPDIILIDVSFISLRDVLPYIFSHLTKVETQIVAMVKPQFEAGKDRTNKGVIKNEAIRRQILREFESWVKQYCVIIGKRDSDVAGTKGNQERFYLLTLKRNSTTSLGRMI